MIRLRLCILLICFMVIRTGLSNTERAQAVSGDAPSHAARPLPIVENQGQFASAFRFQTVGGPIKLGFAEDGIWISLARKLADPDMIDLDSRSPEYIDPNPWRRGQAVSIKLAFEGANPHPRLEPFDPLLATFSTFQGQDPKGWVASAPAWGGIRYADLYPGVDLELTGTLTGWQFRWVIRQEGPNLRPHIVLTGGRFQKGSTSTVQRAIPQILTPLGVIDLPIPASNIPWVLAGQTVDGNQMTEILLPDDHPMALQFPDPKALGAQVDNLVYGTYLGGSLWDEANDIAIDQAGNLYLAGYTLSPNFPAAFGRVEQRHNVDAFVARINADTGALGYLALFQGADLQNGEEWARSIAVDPLGQAFVVGRTNSLAFPVTPGAFDTTINGDWDVFALKLSPTGALDYATFLGGGQLDWATDLAIDDDGEAIITGGTFSADFPISAGAYDSSLNGSRDIFLASLSPDGSNLTYGTFIGGTGQEQGESLARTAAGDIYVTGWTNSTDFPTTPGAYAEGSSGGFDVFAVKVALGNPDLLFATYLGGTGEDRGTGVAVNPLSGEAVIGGRSNSDDFPVTPDAYASALAPGTCDFSPCPDAFLVSVSSTGHSLDYATYIGGSGWDEARDLAVNEDGEIFLSGETHSSDFPVTGDGFDQQLDGDQDGFFSVFSPPVYSLFSSSYLGGENWDTINGISITDQRQLLFVGRTLSIDFPTTPNAHAVTSSGDYDAFAVQLALAKPPKLYLPILFR